MNEYIIGSVRKIIFRGENGYIVGVYKVKDSSSNFEYLKDTSISFTGYFNDLFEDEKYKFYGSIVNHPKYGEQFNVEFCEHVLPEEKDSVVDFLTSDSFRGIGKKTALKIVDVLGSEAIKILVENPSKINLINGLSKKQVESLLNGIEEYSNSYSTIIKLNDLGFTSKESINIYNKYKFNTLNVINENLYTLVEIKEFGFKKIDLIALKSGYSMDDKRRISSSIVATMEELCFSLGHIYLRIDMIYRYTIMNLRFNISEELFIDCLNSLIIDKKIIKINDEYYLKSMWDASDNITSFIVNLSKKKNLKYNNLEGYIDELEKNKNIKYNKEQKFAIKSAIEKNFLIITGGPGTGKTTIVSSIIDLYRKVNKLSNKELVNDLVLLAPTGRASKRLSEKSNFKASTIHSFLKWNKESDKFSINEYNKSDAKIVIVDEASMIDILLFNSLLKGLHNDTKIIVVGDYDQLPSVGPGQLLKDLIESDVLNVVSLKELYRQGEDSSIISLAHDINSGIINENLFNISEDLEFIETNDIVKNLSDIVKKYKDFDYNEFQILAPMYKGLNGIDNLNKIVQDIVNPKSRSKKEIVVGDTTYRECDKVLQLVNMPEERIFNGDIGIISRINNKEIEIEFDLNIVRFTPANFNKFKLGYVVSIHKSQGSEFDTVVLPISNGYGKMLYRKLYYTAVTRSKKKLILIGDISALKNAASNNNQDIRLSSIKDQIIKKYGI